MVSTLVAIPYGGRTLLQSKPLLMNVEGPRSTRPVLCLEYGGPTRCTPQIPDVMRRGSIRPDGAVMCHLEASSEADARAVILQSALPRGSLAIPMAPSCRLGK